MRSILISHSNAEPDRTISLELYKYLTSHKIDCWIDALIKVGKWNAQIGRVMLETPIVIFVASKISLGSDEVMGEVGYYRRTEGKTIVPFVLDKQYYLNIDQNAPEAVYNFGANNYQGVFLEDYATRELAFERLIRILPENVSRLENNPADFEYADGDKVLTGYCGSDSRVEVPPYVKEIADEAFICNGSITKVVIPPSVEKIGMRAFCGCDSLVEVVGMDGVKEIETSAFDASGVDPKENGYRLNGVVFGGQDVKKLVIEDGVQIIANEAFRYCSAEEVIFPQGLKYIGAVAFADCIFLKSLRIPASVTQIGKNAFKGCKRLTSVTFEGTVPQGAEEAFDDLKNLINAEDK